MSEVEKTLKVVVSNVNVSEDQVNSMEEECYHHNVGNEDDNVLLVESATKSAFEEDVSFTVTYHEEDDKIGSESQRRLQNVGSHTE